MIRDSDLEEPLIAHPPGDEVSNQTRLQPSGRAMTRVQTFDKDGGDLDVYRRSLMPMVEEAEDGGLQGPSAVPSSSHEADTFAVTTISLSKVILGSGMLVRRRPKICMRIMEGR